MVYLQKQDGIYHKVNGVSYLKGSVIALVGQFGEYFTLMRDNSPMFEQVHWKDFLDADNADSPFDSIPDLQEYFDKVFNVLYPASVPFYLTTDDTLSETLVKAGKSLIHSITIINRRAVTAYVRIYDIATTPGAGDTPVLMFPVVPQAEDKPISLLVAPLLLYKGFGVRITSADVAEPEAGEESVVLNAVYQ